MQADHPKKAKVENILMTQTFRPCPDSEALGCWGNDRITVGYVSEVNGIRANPPRADSARQVLGDA